MGAIKSGARATSGGKPPDIVLHAPSSPSMVLPSYRLRNKPLVEIGATSTGWRGYQVVIS